MKNFSLKFNVASLLAILILWTTLDACTKSDDTPRYDVSLKTTSLGEVLAGENGKTLYFFTKDAAGTSACEGACLTNWQPFFKETLTLGAGVATTDLSTITRTDGAKQSTYKGWPLYYFKNDAATGEVKGDNVGGVWFVARPHFSVMLATGQLKGNDGKNYTSTYTEGVGETTYLVDSLGRTLYGFAPDKKNKNNYTKADFSNNATWPLAEFSAKNIPSALSAADFGTIQVFGKTQMTYKGWPVYYFGPDAGVRGINKGVSVPRPGVWPILNQNTVAAPL